MSKVVVGEVYLNAVKLGVVLYIYFTYSGRNMFTKNKIYKHDNNTDVAFLVNESTTLEGDLLLRGIWMRITSMNNLHAIANDSITIKQNDITNWKLYEGGHHE
jgi:hypothetical protein